MNYRKTMLSASITAALCFTGTAIANNAGAGKVSARRPQIATARPGHAQKHRNLAARNKADPAPQGTTGAEPQQSAQGGTEQPRNLGTINVTGIRKSLAASLATKRAANSIVDAVTAEDIDKFPATNVAEALAQIPGVTLDRNMPAQQRVSIDGLDPSLNLTLLDGHPVSQAIWLFGTQPDRGFNFSLLPPQIVGKLEVYKSPQAKLPAGGLGGTIIMHTREPLEVSPNTVAGSAGYNYNGMIGEGKPNASLFFSTHNDAGTLGIDVSAQHYEQEIAREGFETIGYKHVSDILATGNPAIQQEVDADKLKPNTLVPNAINIANFRQTEKRNSVLVNLEAAPTDAFKTTVQLMWLDDNLDNVNQSAYGFLFNRPAGIAHLGNVRDNVATSGRSVHTAPCKNDTAGACLANGAVSLLDNFARNADVETRGLDWRTQYDGNGWGFSSQLGISDSTDNVAQTLKEPAYSGGYSWTLDRGVTYDDPAKAADPDYWADAGWAGNHPELPYKVRDIYGQIDFSKDIDSFISEVDAGVRWHGNRTKQTGLNYPTLGGPQTLRQMGYSGLTDLSGVADLGYSDFSVHHPRLAGAGAINSEWQANGLGDADPGYYYQQTFNVKQRTASGYLQADFTNYNNLRGNLGVRVVSSTFDAHGWKVPATCTTFGCELPAGYGYVGQSHTHINPLPSFNIAYTVGQNLVLRGAASETIAWAPYNQYAPYFAANDTVLTASAGNPDLSPYLSENFDITAEWYFNPQSVLAGQVFYKHLLNYIKQEHVMEQHQNSSWAQPGFRTNTGDAFVKSGQCTPTGLCNYSVGEWIDGGHAKVKGFALSYQQVFPLGFGLKANYLFRRHHQRRAVPVQLEAYGQHQAVLRKRAGQREPGV
jgi:iron complex outermembrane receptor protein